MHKKTNLFYIITTPKEQDSYLKDETLKPQYQN